MKFQVTIRGQFENIRGLKIAQKYAIRIKCGVCLKEHTNPIVISEEIIKEIKIKEVHRTEKHNIEVECRFCKAKMLIDIREPDNLEEVVNADIGKDDEILRYHPLQGDECIISEIKSDSAFVYDVDELILDVVSTSNELYQNCEFDKRVLVETRRGEIISIQDFKIAVDQLK